MSTIVMDEKDEVIMKLVHYFITEGNYNPIVVNGVKDEIWLENLEAPYKIVRINSNNIFNDEQLKYDAFKIENISSQIKKKTFSFNMKTLNILLNVNEDLKLESTKDVAQAPIYNNNLEITNENILDAFPNINEKLIKDSGGVELLVNVTKDINVKTEEENRRYERVFTPKQIIITPLIMLICFVMFLVTVWLGGMDAVLSPAPELLLKLGANLTVCLKNHEYWRLFTYMFLHGSAIHLLINMYSLNILGKQLETFIGRVKFLIVYIISGICGGLLSAVMVSIKNPGLNIVSIGASGAIFGIIGSLLYFGFHYRNYLGTALKRQLIPIVFLNLGTGFLISGIDNFCHIGGLIGGLLATMLVGVKDKTNTNERVSGFICLCAYIVFMIYMIEK